MNESFININNSFFSFLFGTNFDKLINKLLRNVHYKMNEWSNDDTKKFNANFLFFSFFLYSFFFIFGRLTGENEFLQWQRKCAKNLDPLTRLSWFFAKVRANLPLRNREWRESRGIVNVENNNTHSSSSGNSRTLWLVNPANNIAIYAH